MSEPTGEERLSILNISMEAGFGDAIDLNADIINATRKMAHNLIVIRNGHLRQAEALLELIQNLAESASVTAELSADLIVSEWGMSIADEVDFEEDDEEDEEE